MPMRFREQTSIVIMTTPVMHHPLLMLSASVYTLGIFVFGLGLLRARKSRVVRVQHPHVDTHP